LTWNNHITEVSKKITRALGIIAKIRHLINRNSLKLIYYTLVYPYLIYAPTNVMPDPREGGDTWGIGLISLLLGRGFDFI
jgi:hypothetical protein